MGTDWIALQGGPCSKGLGAHTELFHAHAHAVLQGGPDVMRGQDSFLEEETG